MILTTNLKFPFQKSSLLRYVVTLYLEVKDIWFITKELFPFRALIVDYRTKIVKFPIHCFRLKPGTYAGQAISDLPLFYLSTHYDVRAFMAFACYRCDVLAAFNLQRKALFTSISSILNLRTPASLARLCRVWHFVIYFANHRGFDSTFLSNRPYGDHRWRPIAAIKANDIVWSRFSRSLFHVGLIRDCSEVLGYFWIAFCRYFAIDRR